jgi:diguanylate cyclase (GGDEF)-like protein
MELRSIPARYQTPAAALFVLLIGTAWLTAWGWRHQATNAIVERELQRSIAVVTALTSQLEPDYPARLRQTHGPSSNETRKQIIDSIDDNFAKQVKGQGVDSLGIFDAAAVLVYSTNRSEVGVSRANDSLVQQALSGKAGARMTERGAPEREWVEVLVPGRLGASQQQDAAFQLYLDSGQLMLAVREDANTVFAIANLVGLTLFAVALMILRRAEEIQRGKDAITGLPGREAALIELTERMRGREGRCARIGWMLVGVQRLRQVSAAYGHETADEVLRETAKRLQALVPDGIGLFRLGGEAFALPIIEREATLSEPEAADRLAREVLTRFEKPIEHEGRAVIADVAIGIALATGSDMNPDELLNRAEVSMIEAKRQGTGHWVLYVPGLEQGVRDRLRTAGDLREAWEKKQFRVHYQPLVDSESRRWVGCEALMRWFHPKRGVITPESFVPLLEETGLIVDVGMFVLSEACRQMVAWRKTLDANLVVSVNLSARQFADPDLLSRISQVLIDTGLPAKALVIEVTETFLALDPDYATKVLTELRKLGVAIAIDDFGVGYSSLSSLRRLPVDILKIDRSFVSQAPTDPVDASIAQAIAALARGLNLILVAEGVETEAQAEFTRSIGCHKHQGYLFARPLDAATFESSYPKT